MWFVCGCQETTKPAFTGRIVSAERSHSIGSCNSRGLFSITFPDENVYMLSHTWVQDSAVSKMFDISSGLKLWLICCLSFDSESTTAGAVAIMLMPECILCAPLAWYGRPVHTQLSFTAGGVSCFGGRLYWISRWVQQCVTGSQGFKMTC